MKALKSVFGLLLGVLLGLVCALSLQTSAVAYADNVIEISSAEDLLNLSAAYLTYSGDDTAVYKLTTDVDLSSSSEFAPIGSTTYTFNATFLGQGHVVTLSYEAVSRGGLFGEISPIGKVKDVVIKGSVSASDGYCGGVAAVNSGLIENCTNFASVTGTGGNYFGGIAGQNRGVIKNSVNFGTVNAKFYAGGITGQNNGSGAQISSCVNFGEITATGANCQVIGGLVGENSAPLSDSYSCGLVSAMGDRIGAAVGYLTTTNGQNVYATGTRTFAGATTFGALPTSFKKATYYDLLSGEAAFSDDTLSSLPFLCAVGYLPSPAFVIDGEIADGFKVDLFSGTGESVSPYLLASKEDFILFAANSKLFSYEGKFLQLTTSLVLDEGCYVSSASCAFSGNFDGNNKTVQYSATGSDYVGLFARIASTGTVHDLTVAATVRGTDYVGALAGASAGVVSDVTASGTVRGNNYVGGLAGTISAALSSCSTNCSVYGVRYVGGIAGSCESATAEDLSAGGSVNMETGASYAYFGGVFGSAVGPMNATGLAFLSDNTAYKADKSGGLFGSAENVTATLCAVVGNVNGKNDVGGLVGAADTTSITDAFCYGSVNGASRVGGLVGSGSPTLTRAYYSGKLGEVREAQIDRSTFRTVAPSTSDLTNVYYNSDEIYSGTDGIAKSAVAISRGDLFLSAGWVSPAPTAAGGSFPYVDAAGAVSVNNAALQKLAYSYFSAGSGTEESPFILSEEIHFRNLSALSSLDASYLTKYYLQSADVAFERDFLPVSGAFSGYFSGAFYAISDFVVAGNGAMFTEIAAGGTVEKLYFANGQTGGATVAVTNGGTIEKCLSKLVVTGNNDLGGLVVTNDGTIENSVFAGRVVGTSASAKTGGIVSTNTGTVDGCVFAGYAEGKGHIGGVTGKNDGVVNRCLVSGTLHAKDSSYYLGGLSGTNYNGSFDNCLLLTKVYVDGAPYAAQPRVGALVGELDSEHHATIYAQRISFNTEFAPFTSRYGSESSSPAALAKTSDQIAQSTANFNNFAIAASSDHESDFSPLPSYFAGQENARLNAAAIEASRLYYFGWDGLSEAKKGSEDNPYLISTERQMNVLRNKVNASYHYLDAHFKVISDITFTASFRPIGRYVSSGNALNRVFSGTFDGDGHVINDLSISENADYGYVGLFAYTSLSFVLKNLTFSDSCSLTSAGDYVGSFVGNNAGSISGCISYATLSATGYIGGIAAVTAVGTEITHCVFAGTFDESLVNAYGITSQSADRTPRFVTTDSWYVRDKGSFVEAENEGYLHNDYGSVLFVDRGGDVEVLRLENGLKFRLLPDASLSGRIMNVLDGELYVEDGSGYLTTSDGNVSSGKSVKYYARFTSLTQAVWTGDADLIAAGYGEGYYYQGQKVTFAFTVKDGYFINNGDYTAVEGTWVAATETVNIRFTKPSGAYNLSIDVKAFSDYGTLNTGVSLVYTGVAKPISLEYNASTAALFNAEAGENGISYYFLPSLNRASAVKDAGSYRVVARIYLAGETRACGRVTKDVVVDKATLSVNTSASEYWETFATKTYDGLTTADVEMDNQYLIGLAESDIDAVTVTANVTWAAATAGAQSAEISQFVLSGEAAKNYTLTAATLSDVAGTIHKKQVVYTIASDRLTGAFTGSAPSIVGTPSTSIGSASVLFTFQKLVGAEGTVVDEEWAALLSKTWHVGRYKVLVSCSDETDYELTAFAEYVYTVTPYVVNELSYLGYENLTYDGSAKSIIGNYNTVNGAIELVDFAFYRQHADGQYAFDGVSYELCASALHAGAYIAVPAIANADYSLDDAVEPLAFTISKNTTAGEIEFEFDGSTAVTIGSSISLTVTSDLYDATLSVLPYGTTRARAVLRQTAPGKYDFVPTRYSTTDQFQFTLVATGSEDYADRSSGLRSVIITAGKLYVGLFNDAQEPATLTFGDELNFSPVYSFNQDLSDPIDPATAVEGFVAPSFSVDATALHVRPTPYSVSLVGGDSDGYKLVAVKSFCTLTVLPRTVRVSVTDEEDNGKVYGEEDGEINFVLLDGENGAVRLNVLPNGEEVSFVGGLVREAGESVGRYEISLGDLAERNADYNFISAISAPYVIEKRNIELVVDAVTKSYGEEDPEITFSAAGGTSFAKDSDISSLTVRVARAEGEDVGRYAYTVLAYNGNENYLINRVDARSNFFTITRATPTVIYSVLGTIEYGDNLGRLTISGDAYLYGVAVEGTFGWSDPDQLVDAVGVTNRQMIFIPESDNFNVVMEDVEITVQKRVADVNFSGEFRYVYNGKEQCDITAAVVNAAFNETVSLNGAPTETPIDVGVYTYQVTLSDVTHYVLENDSASINFEIRPAVVTVKVEDADLSAEERYMPSIVYTGFVNGETKNILTKKATVKDVPQGGGTYEVTASGAEAANYEFVYVAGLVRIAKTVATSSMATVYGDLSAEAVVTSVALKDSALTMREEEVNVALKHNVFIPNFQKMTDYVKVESNVKCDGELTYSVRVKLTNSAKIYLIMKDGSVVGPIEYEVVGSDIKASDEGGESADDGRTEITFTSEEIVGVAVYSDKDTMEIIKSLVPDIIIGIVVLVIIIIIVLIWVSIRKRDKRKEEYRRYLNDK